jgi:hypothetical protein
MLKHVKNQTHEICLEAIKQYPYAIEYIKNLTQYEINTLRLEAVKDNHMFRNMPK